MLELNAQTFYDDLIANCQKAQGGVDYPDIWLDGISDSFLRLDALIRSGDIPKEWQQ